MGTLTIKHNITMKRCIFYLFIMVATALSTSCRENAPKTSVGEPYEVFVICDDQPWDSYIKAATSEVLEANVPGLVRPEKYFHIVDHDNFKDTNDVERKHSNLLAVNIDPTASKTTMVISRDVHAAPQSVVTITSPSAVEAAQYIYDHGMEIREAFEHNERLIHFKTLSATNSAEPINIVRELTGLDMHIPGGFAVARPKEDIMKWFIRKYSNKQQHIFVYTEPCDDINTLSVESIEQSLDNHLGIISVKDEEGSYMCISKERPIYVTAKSINDRVWYETRCCWRVEGYPMGGPLTSYSTYDEANKRLITIAFALFSPEQMQRHDMAQLESLMFLIKK